MNNMISKICAILVVSFMFTGNAMAQVVSGQVQIGSSSYSADWYIPDATPKGLVYLQHGFFRNSGNLRNLGLSLMDQGMMVLSVNANMAGGNASLAVQAADAIADGDIVPPNGIAFPQQLVLAGHSAGALHATAMGARLAELNYSGFSGAVLLDPVDASNVMTSASQAIIDFGRPVYGLLARGGSCNSNNNAEPILANLASTSFVGLKLTSGSTHVDAEGANAGFFARLFCGSPTSANIAYIQDFTAAWAEDMLTGSQSSDYYPGGQVVNSIVNSNAGYLLK